MVRELLDKSTVCCKYELMMSGGFKCVYHSDFVILPARDLLLLDLLKFHILNSIVIKCLNVNLRIPFKIKQAKHSRQPFQSY